MLSPWTATASTGTLTRVLAPIADDVAFKDAADNSNPLLYDKTLSSTLSLMGEDYEWLKGLNPCETVTINLQRGSYTFSGTIALNSLEWLDNRCRVDIELTSTEEHSCLQDRAKERVDLLRSTSIPRQVVSIAPGEVQTFSPPLQNQVSFFGSSPSTVDANFTPPPGSNWTVVERTISGVVATGGGFYEGDVSIRYARMTVTATIPPGDGWTDEGGGVWSRPPITSNATSSGSAFQAAQDSSSILYRAQFFSNEDEIDNCLLLNDVFAWFADRCGLTYQSVFFGANAPASADPTVYPPIVYNEAYERYHNLLIAQKSDVKRYDDFNNATKAVIGWDDLTRLIGLFNCKWEVENGVLRVEHASYFQRGPGLNFTTGAFSSHMAGNWTVKGLGDSLPDQQDFAWMDESDVIFDGVPITYDCNSSAEPEQFNAENFTTNVAFMLNDNPAVEDAGFALMAGYVVNGSYSLVTRTNLMFPAQSPLNGDLAFPNLHALLWLHDGNYPTGTINEAPITMLSTKPQRETTAEVLMCAEDYQAWKRGDNITTPYGDMRVVEANYSYKTGRFAVTVQG